MTKHMIEILEEERKKEEEQLNKNEEAIKK